MWNQSINDDELRHYVKNMKMSDSQISAIMGFSITTIGRHRCRLRLKKPKPKISQTFNWDKEIKVNRKKVENLMRGVDYSAN